jgi:hypothetical protein
MLTELAAPPPLPPKDRSTGLLVFGVLTILLGGIAGLMTLVMIVGSLVPNRAASEQEMSRAALVPGLLMYAGMTVALVWLGIGSIKAQRWARALLLILAWSGLALGVEILVTMSFLLPKLLAASAAQLPSGPNQISPEQFTGIIQAVSLFMGLLLLAVPLAGILFYGREDVKATCERRDPRTRWTDACPLPLLALSLWLWAVVPSMALASLSNHGVLPLFGGFVRGWVSMVLCLLLAGLLGWTGWRIYRRDAMAWWVLLGLITLGGTSNFMTVSRHNSAELYRNMGYSEGQVAQIATTGITDGSLMLWLSVGTLIPLFGYLLWVKRHVRWQP